MQAAGCNESAQLICERSNHGSCRLQRESCHCGDARVMDVLLGLMHCWRCSGEPYTPVCPSVGRNLGELSAGDLPQPDFRGVSGCTSTSRALYGKLAWRAFTRCWPTPEEHIPSGLDRVRVGLFSTTMTGIWSCRCLPSRILSPSVAACQRVSSDLA